MRLELLTAPHCSSTQGGVKESVKVEPASPPQKPRFAPGEYAEEQNVCFQAQEYFLDAVRRVAPEALGSLRNHVWPLYLDAVEGDARRQQTTAEQRVFLEERLKAALRSVVVEQTSKTVKFNVPRYLRDLAKGLLDWSVEFNLSGAITEDSLQARGISLWPLIVAEETLWFWYWSPNREELLKEEPPRWRPAFVHPAGLGNTLPLIQLVETTLEMMPGDLMLGRLKANPGKLVKASADPGKLVEVNWPMRGWNPEQELERQFRKRFAAAVLTWLDGYITKQRAGRERNGLGRAPQKRGLDHFEWVALYQVKGLTLSEIARRYHQAELTVKDALDRTLRLIRLERRPGKRGPHRRKSGD